MVKNFAGPRLQSRLHYSIECVHLDSFKKKKKNVNDN